MLTNIAERKELSVVALFLAESHGISCVAMVVVEVMLKGLCLVCRDWIRPDEAGSFADSQGPPGTDPGGDIEVRYD